MDSVWFEVLVVILSVMLGLFLLLGIILAVVIIKIVKTVNRIVEHAETMADRAEHISEFFESTKTPVAMFKLIANLSEVFKKGKKK